ncbi:hypothetical protein NOR_03232 [Metarhizium rileyi]|uniref:Ribosomal protein bL31m N-terminal domain-containing protein n=2 Tax=Metarhizium rileyi (strain RCEF 4871) TaxID=1649241 RepID=A0A162JQ49_METRR|nr:hypothetical protein NOR_03232 [Metarhizium rileyi RCEF 4871]
MGSSKACGKRPGNFATTTTAQGLPRQPTASSRHIYYRCQSSSGKLEEKFHHYAEDFPMMRQTAFEMAFAPSRSILSHSRSPRIAPTKLAIQVRHATFIPRPRRPYTFTQLVTLSDGSTYTIRTTSPNPIYRASKDTRNTLLWQPSEKSLRNVELDEAGKLAAFRERFGRAFDATAQSEENDAPAAATELSDDVFADLITGYAPQDASSMRDSGPKKSPTRRK